LDGPGTIYDRRRLIFDFDRMTKLERINGMPDWVGEFILPLIRIVGRSAQKTASCRGEGMKVAQVQLENEAEIPLISRPSVHLPTAVIDRRYNMRGLSPVAVDLRATEWEVDCYLRAEA
jgi:hypothetical protein